ncbi:MAG: DUF2142 domain-containing protein [Anaerolineae bacterium]|nr:DUF2142 domain-containing protein [Candidatus Roseilinea sp.]MDW8451334.1 DUF2142 domain-containing protein [Anaerolineae bacterium]
MRIVVPRELLLALALALIHGLAWVFVAPPWEHYDEPSHAEYAWLIAHKGKIPTPDDVDREMRIAFVRSMIRSGFYIGRFPPPDVDDPNAPAPHIGYSQLQDSPLYYFLPAAAIALMRERSIEQQLYAARLTSLLLFLFTVVCAWGVAAALVPPGHPLRWMLPCGIALLPAFADLMTAVNSDAGAIAAFSLFIWGTVYMLNPRNQPRPAWRTLLSALWVIASALLCVQVKGTAAPALALVPVVLLFGALRGRWRPLAWGTFALGSAAALVALFDVGDAALWYRSTATLQREHTRCDANICGPIPHGEHAIRIVAAPGSPPPYVFQSIPPASVAKMRGQTVTFGAWMWAKREDRFSEGEALAVEATSPAVNYNYREQLNTSVTLDETPRFVAITGTISPHAGYARLILPSVVHAPEVTTAVMLDGVVLAVGEFPTDGAPRFENASASRGEWGGRTFENLVRNASGEDTWPALRPQVERFLLRFTPEWVSWILGIASLLDPTGAGWYHRMTVEHMFQTFWARFSWGNVPLADGWNLALAVATAVSLACTLIMLLRHRRQVDWAVVVTMALAIAVVWLPALMRGVMVGLEGRLWIAGARYAYPAIVPTMLALTIGWATLAAGIGRKQRAIIVAGWTMGFVVLAVVSLITVYQFYAARGTG